MNQNTEVHLEIDLRETFAPLGELFEVVRECVEQIKGVVRPIVDAVRSAIVGFEAGRRMRRANARHVAWQSGVAVFQPRQEPRVQPKTKLQRDILQILGNGPLLAKEIALWLGRDPRDGPSVSQQIRRMMKSGFPIEHIRAQGYTLVT